MKTLNLLLGSSVLVALSGCQIYQGIPEETYLLESTAPKIIDLGTLELQSVSSIQETIGEVGRPNKGIGEKGGFTATFVGIGSPVCIVMDPEGRKQDLNTTDDGDMDLFAGLEADYTGTPGSVIGDFTTDYIDALGVVHIDDVNLCQIQYSDFFGRPGAHAGQGILEYCLMDTQADVNYIITGHTFSVPEDDANLMFSVAVLQPSSIPGGGLVCPNVNETTLVGDVSP